MVNQPRGRVWRGVSLRWPVRSTVVSPGSWRGSWNLRQTNISLGLLFSALVLVYMGSLIGQTAVRSQPAPVIQVVVGPGDTLWSLAGRYGDPEEYILRRVHDLASRNHLVAGAPLRPGQKLEVRVENPTERERLLASSRQASR